ncbi:MAG: SMC-Scp complex subunit ScpB [Candidatus Lambdaproteobacteria bacterium RIFOXYD1_FULL_56_27]|uniref:SMC-Scp complex subunit ScpB n=1 Tax=Candidatus Lambdaproteobacteria bacterium RIFOXYD2_FULL_56_26 TaxID=1817773 RepID=A0A1F6H1U2_9PROT|nr:MAG: SMC-Scp complex subunit ScpB [Candidatus Lambdaproteobacteria bacterium RIFOXYC1_FULL_56_13]OGH04353.1 MAG: SMC-Scp complex subunit ScpB [Candidatus Lambdaproteobacteria bacterium RIFOXYD2_FULL_56_26]OGH08672.1 MAG: SMC-Scp complex subunit ScpB [Candidatus Lambdaproteobacteria bacterium RIFOXYD1_FULL_56_27]
MTSPSTRQIVEALLFSTRQGLTLKEMAEILEADKREISLALAELGEEYRSQGRAFELAETGGGYLLRTQEAYKGWVSRSKSVRQVRLGPGLMESLAIVAYHQPVTRAEVEEIRGVDSSYALKSLLEKDLIQIAGKKEAPGKPMLFATSKRFLEAFGFLSLKELPRPEEYDLGQPDQAQSPEEVL